MSKSKKIAIIVSVVFIAAGVIILLGALTAINFDFSKINFAGKSEAKVMKLRMILRI